MSARLKYVSAATEALVALREDTDDARAAAEVDTVIRRLDALYPALPRTRSTFTKTTPPRRT